MFKIKIEKRFNCKKFLWIKYAPHEMVGKWLVGYDPAQDAPVFCDDVNDAGIFVADHKADNAVYGNLMALNDRFGIRGTPIHVDELNENK